MYTKSKTTQQEIFDSEKYDTKMRKDNYIFVGAESALVFSLSSNERLVYSLIRGYTQQTDTYCDVRRETLSEWTNISTKSISKILKELVAKGILIHVETDNSGRNGNFYRALGIEENPAYIDVYERCLANNPTSIKEFCIVRQYMVKEMKLTGLDLLLYAYIKGYTMSNNHAYILNVQHVSAFMNADKSSIFRSISKLIEKGYIAKFYSTKTKSTCYHTTETTYDLDDKSEKEISYPFNVKPINADEIIMSKNNYFQNSISDMSEVLKETNDIESRISSPTVYDDMEDVFDTFFCDITEEDIDTGFDDITEEIEQDIIVHSEHVSKEGTETSKEEINNTSNKEAKMDVCFNDNQIVKTPNNNRGKKCDLRGKKCDLRGKKCDLRGKKCDSISNISKSRSYLSSSQRNFYLPYTLSDLTTTVDYPITKTEKENQPSQRRDSTHPPSPSHGGRSPNIKSERESEKTPS